MIPREIVDEILARTNLPDLISSYVTLKRAGSNLQGLCPFHSEKSPSFTVFPSDNSFYCFGCNVGGDAITFLRKIENLDYTEAVEQLARRVGITIPEQPDKHGYTPKFDRKRIYDMNREAARFFHAALFSKTPKAQEAYRYLSKTRGLSDATIRHFGLGYAPNEYGALSRHLRSLGYTDDEMIAGFLCGKRENGTMYDTFWNRIMFPIIDPSGNVIAFGGRVMDDSKPKYRNSSDTPVFKKSRHLFALNFAKNFCAERMILCEGYMDVISMHAAGFENAVATLGTAITPEQARLMKRYTKQVIISYDMDAAGRNAAEKAMKLFEEVGVEVRLLVIDGAKDPDEFIRKYGASKFREMLDGSRMKFEYQLERVLSQYPLTDAQNRIRAANALVSIIAGVYSAAERDVYLHMTAEKLGIAAASLKSDIARAMAKKKNEYAKKERQSAMQASMGYADTVNPDAVRMPAVASAEEHILGLLLLYPEYDDSVRSGKCDLTEEDFGTEFGKKVFRYLMSAPPDTREDKNSLFSPEEIGRMQKMELRRLQLTQNGYEVFLECINNLRRLRRKDAAEHNDHISAQNIEDILRQRRNSEQGT